MHNIFEHGPLAEMNIEHIRDLSGLASKIVYHIQDNDVHLTEKEKGCCKETCRKLSNHSVWRYRSFKICKNNGNTEEGIIA